MPQVHSLKPGARRRHPDSHSITIVLEFDRVRVGNGEAIALKHYLQVTDDHLERAVRGEVEIGPEVAPTVANTTAQKLAQHAHAGGRWRFRPSAQKLQHCRGLRLPAI